jgi:hypothetical protein
MNEKPEFEYSTLQALMIFSLIIILLLCVVLYIFLHDMHLVYTTDVNTWTKPQISSVDSIKIWQTQVYSICSVFIVSLLALTFLIKK